MTIVAVQSFAGVESVSIALAASGVLVAAVAGRQIRVRGIQIVALLATAVKLQSAANDITGAWSFAANGGIVLPPDAINSIGYCITAVGEALNLNMSVNTTVGGILQYDLV